MEVGEDEDDDIVQQRINLIANRRQRASLREAKVFSLILYHVVVTRILKYSPIFG